MPGKKRFASRADEAIQQKRAALAGAAARRMGAGSRNAPGARFSGRRVSGGGLGAATSQAADRVKRFQPLGGGSTVPTTGGVNTPGGPRVPGIVERAQAKKLPSGLAKRQ